MSFSVTHGHSPHVSHPHAPHHDHGHHDHGHHHHHRPSAGGEGGHAHSAHTHPPPPAAWDRAFALGIALNLGFVGVEAATGILANSVALLADAGHNLSDVLGLGLAWAAVWLSRRLPTARHTYGYGSSSILAALFNSVILLLVTGGMAWEAVERLMAPPVVATVPVMAVAAVGVVINGLTARLFMGGSAHDLNVRGAYLHMLADAAVSVGVVVSALLIRLTGWEVLDPLVCLVITALIAWSTGDLLRQSASLALGAVPRSIDRSAVERYLAGLPGVTAVHDLHIWGLSTTHAALTVHLVRPTPDPDPEDQFLTTLAHALHEQFGIDHATIQVEQCGAGCKLAPTDVI